LDANTGIFNIPGSSGEFELTVAPELTSFSSAGAYLEFAWVYAANNTVLPNTTKGYALPVTHAGTDEGVQTQAKGTVRSVSDVNIKIRVLSASGTATFKALNSWAVISATTTAHLDYTTVSTQVQIRELLTGVTIYQSENIAGFSVSVPVSVLNSATEYEVRARHYHTEGYYNRWTPWVKFTTA
jgi:hypothetical protein